MGGGVEKKERNVHEYHFEVSVRSLLSYASCFSPSILSRSTSLKQKANLFDETGNIRDSWQWIFLTVEDLRAAQERGARLDGSNLVFVERRNAASLASSMGSSRGSRTKHAFLFDARMEVSRYPRPVSGHYTALYLQYLRQYGGDKVKTDLSSFFATLGVVSALILSILDYSVPDPSGFRAVGVDNVSEKVQVYSVFVGLSAVFSTLSIFLSVLLLSKLSQSGATEIALYLYNFGM
jgi:hypothetical protein